MDENNASFDEVIQEETIIISFEDGEEIECEIIGAFEIDDENYMALLPLDSDDLFLYGYSEENDELDLRSIEDDDEFNKVYKRFEELFFEEGDFEFSLDEDDDKDAE